MPASPLTDSQYLAIVLRSVVEAIIATDAKGSVTLLNAAAERLLKTTAAEAQGQPLAKLQSELGSWLERTLAVGHKVTQVFELPLNRDHIFAVNLAPLRDAPTAQVTGWVIVLQEITHLKQLERWKSEAIEAAAHDLQNPVNLLQGALNLLQESMKPTAAQREYLAMLHTGAQRIGKLVERLLHLEEIESDTNLTLSPLTLHQMAEQVVAEFKLAAAGKNIHLEFAGSPTRNAVLGDAEWLQRAMANLVSNALKYTPEGGRVTVRYSEADHEGIVEVSDNGPGIPAVAQARLFERFYRARSTAQKTQGTGLGLAIVKTIIEKHTGRVWVSSEEGQGSTFGFAVPLHKPAD